MCNSVRAEVKAAGDLRLPENLWDFSWTRCAKYLHVCLAFSPSGDKFRIRCQELPRAHQLLRHRLVLPVAHEALENRRRLLPERRVAPDEPELLENVQFHCACTQTAVNERGLFASRGPRNNYTRPRVTSSFISLYKHMKASTGARSTQAKERLENGVDKIANASAQVAERMSAEPQGGADHRGGEEGDCDHLIVDIDEKADRWRRSSRARPETKPSANRGGEHRHRRREGEGRHAAHGGAARARGRRRGPSTTCARRTSRRSRASLQPMDKMNVAMCRAHHEAHGARRFPSRSLEERQEVHRARPVPAVAHQQQGQRQASRCAEVKAYFRDPDFNYENMSRVSTAGAGLLQLGHRHHQVPRGGAERRAAQDQGARARAAGRVGRRREAQGHHDTQLGELEEMLAVLRITSPRRTASSTTLRDEKQPWRSA